jgi:Mn-containing catalase
MMPKDTQQVLVEQNMQSITFDFKMATELLDMFGGEPGEVTVCLGDGHSGKGVYAYWTEIPEEGTVFLGVSDDEAMPENNTELSAEFDVRKILLYIVPGDGMGFEVFAKNVADVEDKLTELIMRVDDLQTELDNKRYE